MSGPRFRILSGGLAALMVFGLLGTSVAAAATGSAKTAKVKTATVKTAKVARHQTAPSHALKPQVRRAALRAATQRAKRPLADGVLSAENEAMTVARHTKKVKLAKPTTKVAPLPTKKLKNGAFGPALAAPLDAQFAGLDENNDDLDPLNVGDDYSADTDGAVGPHYYGEVVGSGYGFFDKATGALVADDSLLNLFTGTGMGSPCEASDDNGYYEPHILYDSQSDRWIIMTSAAANPDTFTAVGPTDECIAVSASGDPVNGDWYFYMVPLIGAGALDVYQSAAGIWTDGLYFSEVIGCEDANSLCPSYNANEGLEGSEVWDFNRSDLESGAPLRVQTTQGVGGIGSGNFGGSRTTTTFSNLDADGLVPANLETMTGVPPAGRNEYFLSMSDLPGSAATPLGDGLMDIWQYHVDWSNPANSWVGQSASNQTDYQVTTPTYGVPDDSSGTATSAGPTAYANPIDTNYDYILPKPQYTDFSGVESLWTAHATSTCSGSCNGSSTTGPDRVRWNQISINSGSGAPVTSGPTQGQDYAPAPTALNRWLPAIGVDQDGDMAVGYSGTDSTVFPSLYIAGAAEVASAAANSATIGTIPESEVYAGDGYQTGATDLTDVADTGIGFFGPENSMSLDPNGCEMWFAGQVDVGSPTSPTGDDDAWATEVSAFHFPGCTPSTLATSLTASGSADASAGTGTVTATLTENGTGGSGVAGEVVDFSLGGTPVGTATTDSDGVATLSGVDTSTYAAGSYAGAVGATFAGDSAYNYGASSPASGSLLVGTPQTISFGPISGSYTYGGAGPTLSATASSALPVTFSASGDNGSTDADNYGVANSGTCSVTGSTVTITGAGLCTITATQAGDGATYLPAPPVSQTFDIAQEAQTITSTTTTPTNPAVGADFKMSGVSSSGGQVYFTADETGCTEVDNGDTPQDEFVSLNSSCTIYAEQDGSTDIAQVIQPVALTFTGMATQTGKFAVTSASRRLDQLQNTADDVTWSSGLTDSTYSTSGTISLASVAASTALTVAAAATPVTITGAKESGTTVTITVGSNPYSTGNSVVIAGITPAGYNGTYTVTKPGGSSGNTTFTYTDTSGLTSPATSVAGATATLASSGATESGNTVTLTTTASNAGKLTVGHTVSVVGVGVAGYNGTYTVASIPSTTTFTYSDSTTGLGASGGGTVGDTSITGASESGTTVTLNLTAPPGVTLTPGSSVITVAGVTPTGYNGSYTVTAVPTSTSVQYTGTAGLAAGGAGVVSQPGTSCTASGGLGNESLTALHAGTCTVTATQAGNGGFSSGSASITYTLTAGNQSVTWSPAGGNISATNPTSVSVTTNSGVNPGTVTSTTTSVCTVGSTTPSGGTSTVTVTPVSPGTCTLSAAGNSGSLGPDGATDWNALTAKTVSLTVANTLADQLIEFAPLPDVTYGVAPFAVSATSVNAYYPEEVSSGTPTGLPVSYAASGTCTVDGSGNVTVTGAGICTITASQPGNSVYNPAGSIGNEFTVNQAASSINFPNPGPQAGGTSFSPSATASDGAAVTFTASGDCTTTGNGVIQLTTVGSCTVTAHGVGTANFTPPADNPQTFAVTAGASSTTTAPTNATIVLGNSNSDTATVDGNAASGSPTGTVSFYECGPTATPQACISQASPVGSAVGLTATAGNDATATSVSFTPTSGGWWCFAGYYSGDSNYSSSTDTTTDECFDVSTAPSNTVTTPTSATIVAGSGNTDGATVTGNSTGGSPTGTVSFFECGPTAAAEPCTSTDNPVGSAVSLTAGPDDTATVTSPSFTPGSPGTWCFAGYYSGDGNYSASTDTTIDECFVVSADTNVTTTPAHATIALGASNTDQATVPGDALSGSPTGTVSFYECGPTATAQACTSQADPVGAPVNVSAGPDNTATATSPAFTPASGGYWCFAAYYSGDSNYAVSDDTSTTECFDVPPVITSAGSVTFVEGVPATPFQVTSTGGFAPITYSETGALPSGVTLSSSGVLSGTPGFVAGQFLITITASGGGTGTQSFTLYVTPSNVLHVTTTSLPGAQKGVAYSAHLAAAGGKTPYKWKITSGVLPKGLTMNKTGVISGKPKSNAVSETFTVTVTDKSHPKQTASATLTITVS